MADEVSQRYGDLLDGSYDCVDRIVLNGYFRLCYSGGGFREWWRRLMGSEERTGHAHLMRWPVASVGECVASPRRMGFR